METIIFEVNIVKRSSGSSAIQRVSYYCRDKLHSEYTGKDYDYRYKKDLVYHEVMLPKNAPHIYSNSEVLWNEVEAVEKNKNSRLARVVMLPLPRELTREKQIELFREYIQRQFVDKGMCADVSMHDKGDGNPHVHVMLTLRSIDENGNWMYKERRNYLLDANGERIINPVTGKPRLGATIKTNDWNSKARIYEWRKGWADICNRYFSENGIDKEVTHLSYEKQGIEREPTRHLGVRVKALEDRGIRTDIGNMNREIRRHNRNIQRLRTRDKEKNPYSDGRQRTKE